MAKRYLILLGFLTMMVVVVLYCRTAMQEITLPPAPTTSHEHLQPELALERAEPARKLTQETVSVPDPQPLPPIKPPSIADLTTALAVEQWLENQAAHLNTGGSWSRNDPLIDEFARVPSAFWAVMLNKTAQFSGRARGLMEHALIRSAGPQHRDVVLQALPDRPFLIPVIVRHGWVADAAETMRRLLADAQFVAHKIGDTYAIIAALATLQDERDFHRFLVIMREHRYGYWQARIARVLASVPAFDLDTAVHSSWRYHAVTDYPDHQDAFAVAAARVGMHDALAITVLHAAGGKGTAWSSEELQHEARALLRDHLGVQVDPNDPAPTLSWWASAKDHVRWDAQARRWLGPPPPPPPLVPAEVVPPANTQGADDF